MCGKSIHRSKTTWPLNADSKGGGGGGGGTNRHLQNAETRTRVLKHKTRQCRDYTGTPGVAWCSLCLAFKLASQEMDSCSEKSRSLLLGGGIAMDDIAWLPLHMRGSKVKSSAGSTLQNASNQGLG